MVRPHFLSRGRLRKAVKKVQRGQIRLLRTRILGWLNEPGLPRVLASMLVNAYGKAPEFVREAWDGRLFDDLGFLRALAEATRDRDDDAASSPAREA